ncbi:aromatase/cyclase [Streptomyces albireticuli]|uniref:Cyclase n=1 Tax=Streptomyces albireticuli TaxID=1940 RepID=A0A2A2DFW7_9ACTN|nr:aromatase/cyclase [Streptomyces albireticuli]MCD9141285.1 aromatase/cyclase [Streptomyces albireticuli]MCD9160754.1 aromatase/cyclase [Streptomyces albireticuli]MCD9191189.1 aromatase/cyclase [Streptomyces albireticuli]PAU50366.1 cyclase [Streptomyces albireticuli]
MTELREHHTLHTRVVAAPADTVYQLVADVTRWPVIFEPTLHVRHLERDGDNERFRLWALVNGEVKDWTSRRVLDPEGRTVSFRQEHSRPPFASMGGQWRFAPQRDGRTMVSLTHDFTVPGQEAGAWATEGVNRNSERELAALARIAELPHAIDDLVFSFTDRLELSGAAADAYAFVDRADAWPERLPHVRRVRLREDPPGVQDMEMDTVTADGSAHTTRSVRLCFPDSSIVYKQLVPPALLFGHSGAWEFTPDGAGGAVAVARHTVAVDPAAVPKVLGEGRTLADARAYLRAALGANSRTTLGHAAAHAGANASALAPGGPPHEGTR